MAMRVYEFISRAACHGHVSAINALMDRHGPSDSRFVKGNDNCLEFAYPFRVIVRANLLTGYYIAAFGAPSEAFKDAAERDFIRFLDRDMDDFYPDQYFNFKTGEWIEEEDE